MRFSCQHLLGVLIFLIWAETSYGQGDRCSSIQPFCAGTTEYVFQNSSPSNGSVSNAEGGPSYGCLETQPYPAWFYLKISDPGNLNFQIRQAVNPDGSGAELDVDYIAWGPFQEDENYCSGNSLNSQNIVGCSFSTSGVESFVINNARQGEIYVVLITNFSEKAGYISLQQTNITSTSAGSTDCSIVNILGEDQAVCSREFELVAENVIATRYEWYVFDEGQNQFNIIPGETGESITVSESGFYKVITINENTGTRLEDEVLVEFLDPPVATAPEDLEVCTSEATATFNLNEVRDQLLQNYPGTFSEYSVNFYASQENFNDNRPINSPGSFQGADEQQIFASITHISSGCTSEAVSFLLKLDIALNYSLPEFTSVCLDSFGNINPSIPVGEDGGGDYIYQWTPTNDPDGDGVENPVFILSEIPSDPVISVQVTDKLTGCSSVFSTELQLFSPPQAVDVVVEGSDFGDGYIVTANVTGGIGTETTYEYRLDGGSWQESPVFRNVAPGAHVIQAREIHGCGSASSETFRLIGFPRFFTPNSDGYNDTWNVINDPEFSISEVLIFDRYGKLLKQLDPSSGGWNGTYNGKEMPATDYWFRVEYRDPESGEVKEYKGNFSLIRKPGL